jgi:transcriptional regulator with XRE-family HTH domain
MRHPNRKKSTVAQLRAILGPRFSKGEQLDQERFAKLIRCSIHRLQNIEAGRTKLDEGLARQIADATGISCEWLLANDPEAPPVADVPLQKVPYTLETFRRARIRCDIGVPTRRESIARARGGEYAMVFYAWMRALFSTKNADIALWRTGRFLEQLANEYGHNRAVLPAARLEVAALADHLRWEQVEIGMRLAGRHIRELRRRGKKSPRSDWEYFATAAEEVLAKKPKQRRKNESRRKR